MSAQPRRAAKETEKRASSSGAEAPGPRVTPPAKCVCVCVNRRKTVSRCGGCVDRRGVCCPVQLSGVPTRDQGSRASAMCFARVQAADGPEVCGLAGHRCGGSQVFNVSICSLPPDDFSGAHPRLTLSLTPRPFSRAPAHPWADGVSQAPQPTHRTGTPARSGPFSRVPPSLELDGTSCEEPSKSLASPLGRAASVDGARCSAGVPR